jgi:hypothetical protein
MEADTKKIPEGKVKENIGFFQGNKPSNTSTTNTGAKNTVDFIPAPTSEPADEPGPAPSYAVVPVPATSSALTRIPGSALVRVPNSALVPVPATSSALTRIPGSALVPVPGSAPPSSSYNDDEQAESTSQGKYSELCVKASKKLFRTYGSRIIPQDEYNRFIDQETRKGLSKEELVRCLNERGFKISNPITSAPVSVLALAAPAPALAAAAGPAAAPALRPNHPLPPPLRTDFADDSSTVSEHTRIHHDAPLSDSTKQFEEQVKRERAGSELPNWTKNLHENFFRPIPKIPGVNTSTNTSPLPNSDGHTEHTPSTQPTAAVSSLTGTEPPSQPSQVTQATQMTQPTLISSMTATEPPSQVNQATQVTQPTETVSSLTATEQPSQVTQVTQMTQPTEAISSITAATAATQVVPSSRPMVLLNEFYVTFQIDSSGTMLHPMTVKRDSSGGDINLYWDPSSNTAALTYEDLTVWYNAAMINAMEETPDLSANMPDSYLVTFKRYLPEPSTGPGPAPVRVARPEPVEKERMVLKNGEMLYQDPDIGDLVAKKRELDIIYRTLGGLLATNTGSNDNSNDESTPAKDTSAQSISETANVPVATAAEVVAAPATQVTKPVTDNKRDDIQGPTYENG